MANPNLPFGGVGHSGHGRLHGYEGFKQFSNQKSILSKPALNFYPYDQVYPPFSGNRPGLIKFLMKYLGCTLKQFFKRLFWTLVILYILKQIWVGNLSMKTFRKYQRIGGMIGTMLPMLLK